MVTTQVNDIYSFINSRDIGEHCRELNHKFNPLEAAYLIWRSERRTLTERHMAWKDLINTTPDMPIPNTQYKSLHEFLNSYMEAENNFLNDFCADDDNTIYFCNVYDDCGKQELFPQDSVFKTLNDCFTFVQELKNKINVIDFYICKSSLTRHKNIMGLNYSSSFEPLRIISSLCETDLFHTFCTMCPVVPAPFEKGDIVKMCHKRHCGNRKPTAYVLDTIGYLETAEDETGLNKSKNYNAILYSLDEGNAVSYIQIPDERGANNEIEAWGFTHNYLDLEYYHGELKDRERILIGISNYLKGNINLSFLMNTYNIISLDELLKDMKFPRGSYGGCDAPLERGGWTDEEVKAFKEWDKDILKEIL